MAYEGPATKIEVEKLLHQDIDGEKKVVIAKGDIASLMDSADYDKETVVAALTHALFQQFMMFGSRRGVDVISGLS